MQMESGVPLEKLDQVDQLALLDLPVVPAYQELLVHPVHKEREGNLAKLVLVDKLVLKEKKVNKEPREMEVPRDNRETKERLVKRETEDL